MKLFCKHDWVMTTIDSTRYIGITGAPTTFCIVCEKCKVHKTIMVNAFLDEKARTQFAKSKGWRIADEHQ